MVKARASLLREIRTFFDSRGFYEVQPPCLSADCVVDAYIDSLSISAVQMRLPSLPGRETFFLQSSPESAMKRMLVDGAPSIYSIGPVYRAGEVGQLHNPEFTMLEWYHRDSDVESEIALVQQFVCEMLHMDQCDTITYANAFMTYLGFHPLDVSLDDLYTTVATVDKSLAEAIRLDRDSMLDVLISEFVQPKLGTENPVVLRDYPATQAALARVLPSDVRFAARFELYYHGVELANGYEELLDAEELIRRGHENNHKRRQCGLPELTVETSLVKAMRRGMPRCAGVAMGLDRLLMLRMGATSLAEVIPLPIDVA
jgi:elongation factor P--(R)-beta-lysine ligase